MLEVYSLGNGKCKLEYMDYGGELLKTSGVQDPDGGKKEPQRETDAAESAQSAVQPAVPLHAEPLSTPRGQQPDLVQRTSAGLDCRAGPPTRAGFRGRAS